MLGDLQGQSTDVGSDVGDLHEECYVTHEEIEMEHNMWDFKDPASIIDSVLFTEDKDRSDDVIPPPNVTIGLK